VGIRVGDMRGEDVRGGVAGGNGEGEGRKRGREGENMQWKGGGDGAVEESGKRGWERCEQGGRDEEKWEVWDGRAGKV